MWPSMLASRRVNCAVQPPPANCVGRWGKGPVLREQGRKKKDYYIKLTRCELHTSLDCRLVCGGHAVLSLGVFAAYTRELGIFF